MRRRLRNALPLAALAAALPLGCGAAPDRPDRPHVVLISIDTLRPDHLGCYGHDRPTSPRIDRVAAEGVLFEQAVAHSPWTLPSHASLLTGLDVPGHGMRDVKHQLAPEIPTLAERFAAAGYETAAFVNAPYLLERSGLVRGTDRYRYYPLKDASRRPVLSAARAVEEILAWLGSRPDARPFFLFLHTFDVHSDYQPGPRYRERFVRPYRGALDGRSLTLRRVRRGALPAGEADADHLRDLYDAVIAQLDDRLAPLLDALDAPPLRSRTVLAITSDHGEEFLEHGSVLHGRTLYEEVLRVPLLLRGPGIPVGVRVRELVRLVDVAPTLLARAGLPVARPLDGRDLAPLWSGPAPPEPVLAFAEAAPWKLWQGDARHLASVRGARFKLIADRTQGVARLFDLAADPAERRDVSAEHPEEAERLKRQLETHLGAGGAQPGSVTLSPEDVELLESLGYVN